MISSSHLLRGAYLFPALYLSAAHFNRGATLILLSVHFLLSSFFLFIRYMPLQISAPLLCIYSVLLLICCLGLEAHVYVHTLAKPTCTRIHMPNARVGNCFSFVCSRVFISLASSLSPRVRMCAHTALRRAARVHARVFSV